MKCQTFFSRNNNQTEKSQKFSSSNTNIIIISSKIHSVYSGRFVHQVEFSKLNLVSGLKTAEFQAKSSLQCAFERCSIPTIQTRFACKRMVKSRIVEASTCFLSLLHRFPTESIQKQREPSCCRNKLQLKPLCAVGWYNHDTRFAT